MIFNAAAMVPGEVSGKSTGDLADSQVVALNIGFDGTAFGAQGTSDAFFGTIDQSQASGGALPPGVRHLRAQFTNSALADFDQG